MASRKSATITSYFVRPRDSIESVVNSSRVVQQSVVTEEEDAIESEFQQTAELEVQQTNEPEVQRLKRKEAASFKGEAIMKQQRTSIGCVVLVSAEETQLPIVSVRAKEREDKKLTSSSRRGENTGESRTEVELRIRDPRNGGYLIYERAAEGLMKLWCRLCLIAVNPNKAHTAKHMSSKKHMTRLQERGQQVREEDKMRSSLAQWRKGNPDN